MSEFAPSRRELLALMGAATAMAFGPEARAELGPPEGDNPGYFRFTLGEARITVISDGYFRLPASGLGVNADPAEVQDFLKRHYLSTEMGYSHTNHLYVELGDARVLVDVGSGSRFIDTAGRLMANMEAAGIDPAGVTHVAITHAHPDHIWGIRDDFDEPLFPDATYIVGGDEYAYWTRDGLVDEVAPEAQHFVVGAVNSLTVEGVDWVLAGDGYEIVPGMWMVATPGHTPGHMSVELETGGKRLIALGDAMTHAHLNFAHPEWVSGNDMDEAQTIATRTRLLQRAAAEEITMLGYHFPFPGVGHVMKEDEAFRYIPALWQF